VTVAGAEGGATAGIGYVSRISPDASKVLWSTTAGSAYGSVDTLFMAQDATGAIDVLGRYARLLVDPGLPPKAGTPPGLFTAKLSSDGSQLLFQPTSVNFWTPPHTMNTGLYPQTLVSLFGYNLASVSQVLMSGSAQILYAGQNQINVEVPAGFCACDPRISGVLPSGTISFTPPHSIRMAP